MENDNGVAIGYIVIAQEVELFTCFVCIGIKSVQKDFVEVFLNYFRLGGCQQSQIVRPIVLLPSMPTRHVIIVKDLMVT